MDEHRSASKGFRVINTTPSPQHAVSALGKSGGVHATETKGLSVLTESIARSPHHDARRLLDICRRRCADGVFA